MIILGPAFILVFGILLPITQELPAGILLFHAVIFCLNDMRSIIYTLKTL